MLYILCFDHSLCPIIRKLTSELTGYLEELEELQARRKTIVDYFNISQVDAEIKVVSRKISDKRIRIRNLEKATTRNNKINSLNNSKLSHSFIKLLEELNSNGNNSASESIICEHEPIEDNDSNINETGSDKIDINEGIVRDDDILYEDEEFDPNESELERVRPSSRICPSYPLPHSMQKLSPFYLKRVGLWKDNYILGLNTTLLGESF